MASGQYQNVNGVKTLNLHGKNYVEVAERVHMVHEKKAVFSIVKSEPVNVADRWLWVAVIVVDGQQYIGNAEIKMNAPKNTPDGTNPFECGETSAIGRALAFAGFGSVESIASKDEIERGKPYEGTDEEKPTTPATRSAQATERKPAQEAPKTDERPAPRGASVDNGQAQIPPAVRNLKSRANQAGLVHNLAEWMALKKEILGHEVKDVDLTEQQIKTIENHMAAKAS